MFSVVLPDRHRAIETYLPVSGGIMLSPTDEVCDWLEGNGLSLVSIEPIGGVPVRQGEKYITRAISFNFTDADDALLFKLTWGGA